MDDKDVEFRAPKRSFFTPLHIAVLAVALLPMILTGVMVGRGEQPLPVLQPMPDFHLVNQRGERLRPQDLEGKVLVVSFLFTHCPDVCPATVSRLKSQRIGLTRSVRKPGISFALWPSVWTGEVTNQKR